MNLIQMKCSSLHNQQESLKAVTGCVLMILFVRQLTLLFTLSALFVEPKVDKVQAGKLEEKSKSHSKHRHVYFLLADAAAVAVAIA